MRPIPEVTDADIAFPSRGPELVPDWKDIPEEFKRKRCQEVFLFNSLFYEGTTDKEFRPRDGVDTKKALRVLRVVMGTYGLKHEHKEAAWSFLFREWFELI